MGPRFDRSIASRVAWMTLAASPLCAACAPVSFTFSAPDAEPEDASVSNVDGGRPDGPRPSRDASQWLVFDASLVPPDGCTGDPACVACASLNDQSCQSNWTCDLEVRRCLQCDPAAGWDCPDFGVPLVCTHGDCLTPCDGGMDECPNSTPYCGAEGVCVECKDSGNCPGSQLCGITGHCVDCMSTLDCDGGLLCRPLDGRCVGCVSDGDCGDAGFTCTNYGRCLPTGTLGGP